jgi:hypothetical protein
MPITVEYKRLPDENPTAPAVIEFDVPPGQQVVVSHELRPTRKIDPETGEFINEVTSTKVRIYSTDDEAKDMADVIRRDAPTRG